MRAFLIPGLLALFCLPLVAASEAEEDFWTSNEGQKSRSVGLAPFPGTSTVDAGVALYGSFGGDESDEWSAGLRIDGVYRDAWEYIHFRIAGFVGFDGISEGLVETQVALIKALKFAFGGTYTDRLDFSLRYGLYVEDETDPRRKGGIFMLQDEGGGLEISWPLDKKWSVWGEFSREEPSLDKYQKLQLGAMYQF